MTTRLYLHVPEQWFLIEDDEDALQDIIDTVPDDLDQEFADVYDTIISDFDIEDELVLTSKEHETTW